MRILRLVDKDTYIEAIVLNCTNEWIEEIVITHNAFKAKDVTGLLYYDLNQTAEWVREHHNTLIEVVEVL